MVPRRCPAAKCLRLAVYIVGGGGGINSGPVLKFQGWELLGFSGSASDGVAVVGKVCGVCLHGLVKTGIERDCSSLYLS